MGAVRAGQGDSVWIPPYSLAMRPLFALALLLAACGDDASSSETTSTSGEGGEATQAPAVGSGGAGGLGSGGEAGQTSTVGPVTSVTSTSGPGTGGGGSDEGGATGAGGSGGSGGSEPICEAASCEFSADATDTINCREDCGVIDERCSTNVCVSGDAGGEIDVAGVGVVEILTPELLEVDPLCAAECGGSNDLLWAMRLRILVDGDVYASAFDGPADSVLELDRGDEITGEVPSICEASTASANGCGVSDGENNYLAVGITSAHPSLGGRFRIETRIVGGPNGDDVPEPACTGTCNGS